MFTENKLLRNWGKFSSTVLLLSNIWHKECLLLGSAVLEIYLKFDKKLHR